MEVNPLNHGLFYRVITHGELIIKIVSNDSAVHTKPTRPYPVLKQKKVEINIKSFKIDLIFKSVLSESEVSCISKDIMLLLRTQLV